MINVFERPENKGKRLFSLLKLIKNNLKSLLKRCFFKTNLPSKSRNFDKLYQNPTAFEVLNRFEQSYFKLTLVHPAIVQYRQTIELNNNELPTEGEKYRTYRKNGNDIHITPRVSLYSIENGAIVGQEGYIYDLDKNFYITETIKIWFPWQKDIYDYYRTTVCFPAPKYVDGINLSLVVPGGTGYYHFIIESLTKYLLIKKKYPQIKIDYLTVTGSEDIQFIKPWLALAGNTSEIIFTNFNSHYLNKQLLFLNHINFQYSPNETNISLLRGLISDSFMPDSSGDMILYATRKGYKTRHVDWEEELLKNFNIVEVDFSKLTPKEVIIVCQKCSVFIGAHGAALTNIVFCKPGTEVIEIGFGINEIIYSRLAEMASLNHKLIDISQKEQLFDLLKRGFIN